MYKLLLVIFLGISPLSVVNANALKDHPSPYLAMHGADPVNWMEWGEDALQKARKENKVIFVSIGYFACHWCHVMHRESFSNDAIAKKLNNDYISVKVDRELNPVLDKRLIEFVTATNGHAGWPLSVFITPDGDPLVGATYIPPESFSKALTTLATQWKTESDALKAEAKGLNVRLNTALGGMELQGSQKHVADNREKFISEAMEYADTLEGGFGEQRKFPSSPQLQALFELNKTRKKAEVDEFIRLTLDMMAQKGLHDEVGGGFYRYTIDQGWRTPHFEKMLYNNALLPILYLDAADYYQHEPYRQVALETLSFLQESMRDKSGAFVASLSAVDDKGVEGGYYLWSREDLKKILTEEELKLANVAWGMDKLAELDAGVLPMMQQSLGDLSTRLKSNPEAISSQLEQLKTKLKEYRKENRVLPVDHKLLSGWNGLVLAAYAKALNSDNNLKPVGQKLANFLISMWTGEYLRLSTGDQQRGTLSDYAAVSWGLMAWAAASDDKRSKEMALKLINYAWKQFYQDNRWQEKEGSLLPEGVRAAHISDEPIPSSETLLIRASLMMDDKAMTARVKALLEYSSKSLEGNPYSYASLIVEATRLSKERDQ